MWPGSETEVGVGVRQNKSGLSPVLRGGLGFSVFAGKWWGWEGSRPRLLLLPPPPKTKAALHVSIFPTESKFILFTTQQANQETSCWAVIATSLFEKSTDWEDRGLVSQNTFSPRFEFRLLLYLKREGLGLVAASQILYSYSHRHRFDHNIPMDLNKTNVTLCSLQPLITVWMKKWYTLKGQNLENGLSYIFQIIGNILNLCVC